MAKFNLGKIKPESMQPAVLPLAVCDLWGGQRDFAGLARIYSPCWLVLDDHCGFFLTLVCIKSLWMHVEALFANRFVFWLASFANRSRLLQIIAPTPLTLLVHMQQSK